MKATCPVDYSLLLLSLAPYPANSLEFSSQLWRISMTMCRTVLLMVGVVVLLEGNWGQELNCPDTNLCTKAGGRTTEGQSL
jgi:hypothetical protein